MKSELIPFEQLELNFLSVEAEACEGEWIRPDLLADPRWRRTALAYLVLEFRADCLDTYPSADVLWTRWYWLHRTKRLHEILEHDGDPSPAHTDWEQQWCEDAGEFDFDWSQVELVEVEARTDAEEELGPGPHERPSFGCGDLREFEKGLK